LILAALGLIATEGGEEIGESPAAYHRALQKGRAALQKLGAELRPTEPLRPGWKQRKRGR
jgi:hypothetical protein